MELVVGDDDLVGGGLDQFGHLHLCLPLLDNNEIKYNNNFFFIFTRSGTHERFTERQLHALKSPKMAMV